MSSIEEEIFVEPDQLKTRMRLSEDDLKKVFAAFDEAGIEIKELEWYGVSVFDLSLGEVENIKNNNRILLIKGIILKWHEKNEYQDEPKQLSELLESKNLIQVKELWWSNYLDFKKKKEYLSRRKNLIKQVIEKLDSKAWSDLMSEFGIPVESDHDSKIDRRRSIAKWELKNGYIQANNAVLENKLESLEAHGNGDCLPSTNSATEWDFGLIYCEQDKEIAARIIQRIEEEKYTVCDYHKYVFPSGQPKSDKPIEFLEQCICVLCICTKAFSTNDGPHKYVTETIHYSSVADQSRCGVFIDLIPRGSSSSCVPQSRSAYEPLGEDDKFVERLRATFRRIKKKRDQFEQRPSSSSSLR